MSPLVFVGAGGLGQKIARAEPPVAFIDGDPALVGTIIQGVPILTFDQTRAMYPDATYCVTIWGAGSSHRIQQTENVLVNGGIRDIIPFAHLLRRNGLSHYFIGPTITLNNTGLEMMDMIWGDELSEHTWFENSQSRYRGTVSNLPEPIPGPQYLRTNLFTFLGDREVVYDGGAFDGDTLRDWVAEQGANSFVHWAAFEPHPDNAQDFRRRLAEVPFPAWSRAALHEAGLGAQDGAMAMTAAGGLDARLVSGIAGPRVPVVAIDTLPGPGQPTFVKLDIEGAELDALAGMRETVRRCRPVMAVCIYHEPDHLWRVPLALREMLPDAKLYLRPHGAEGWDTVCYAVPPERAV